MRGLEAITYEEQLQELEKPGSCPKLPPGRITICTLYCRYDWQCPRREKCCTYGCTAVCKDPV
uniref:WAP domain-containing protein n=2 Tax=Naja naja TaxID=35670 RepID=A0A8C6XDL6_NAJNA